MKNSFIKVGKIKDAHSLKGEVYVLVFSGETAWADKLKSQPVKVDESLLKVKEYRRHKQGLIVKFENFNDRNQAEAIKGQMFYIPEEYLTSQDGESIYLNEVLNFEVVDVGIIVGFSSNGSQDLIVVETKNGEFEVPFIEEFIDKIDFANKKVFMSIPEGLVD